MRRAGLAAPATVAGLAAPALRSLLAPGAALLIALAACTGAEESGEAETAAAADTSAPPTAFGDLPDTVRIAEPGLHPEGVEWDAGRGRFLVSSVTTGAVTAVRDDGSLEPLTRRVEGAGAIGIHIDRETDRLLVAHADLGVFQGPQNRGVARLGIYDLAAGTRVHLAELGALRPDARHFANDVTVGPDGTAYVTDSFAPVIYAVTSEGEASVLVEDERLGATPIGLNGIDYHPDGYLLAAVAGRGALVKVPVEDPGALVEVSLPRPFGADGLFLMEDGALVAVVFESAGDTTSEVVWLRSDDGWASAEIVARGPSGSATTATVREGAVYAVDPHFEAMGSPEPHPSFEIYRVEPGSGSGAAEGEAAAEGEEE